MTPTIAAVAVAFTSALGLPTVSREVSPEVKAELHAGHLGKKTKPNAVLLIHGLFLHLLRPERATDAELQDWQRPKADLVKELAADFDVYSFGYAQTAPLDVVATTEGMRERIAALKAAGYEKIVLVGHSAGGVVARQFVERYPTAGVTKVIQVACPNEGVVLANFGIGLPKLQTGFIKSLAPDLRREVCKTASAPLPKDVEFAVVVTKFKQFQGDVLVDVTSQWPDDLQKQGVPAVLVSTSHNAAVKDPATIHEIGALARGKLTRWNETEVADARKVLFDGGPKTGLMPKVVGVIRDRIGLDKKK